ncbi:ALF repeat-containing protein [Streptomyces venezuelae]|uniref:ALF repeat-containing protein n=1 Tax=Streptomyces venezuelae TaxID=54571 RepID=UPI00278BF4F4|nr:ALF repeat-containing protein [Streptomyces venezuelae]
MHHTTRAARAVIAAALTGGLLAGAAPAWADGGAPETLPGTIATPPADPAADIAAQAAAEARARVERLAKSALPAEIRTSAWNALRSTRGDAAVADWLAPGGGYDAAKQRLRDARSRNKAFCERVVRTHPASFSPEVRAAAERALKGSDADRAAFVRTGYAAAELRDRTVREADAQHRVDVAAGERAFVLALVTEAPGEQVRTAARWALRPGATDADVAEFFGYGWANGAMLDLEAYRLGAADAEVRRHHVLTGLVERAAAVERTLESAPDKEQARTDAVLAWRAVAEHADAAHLASLAQQESARVQAENWRSVTALAEGDGGELWKHITAPARARGAEWEQERVQAGETAVFWEGMAARARASAARLTN